MIFQQVVNEEAGCLSYLIGCGQAAVAAVVDPGRDRVDEYIALAHRKRLSITHVFETHMHADHISGNRELAAKTGARIFLHPAAGVAFEHVPVRDGEEITLGNVILKILHTPGHTPESICILATDRARAPVPWLVLTGDTLFVGDAGRPDLGGETAGELYDSLFGKLLTLEDSVEVYPGHGAGSLCGRAMSAKWGSTIGFERRFNGALQARAKEEFVRFIISGIPPTPPNFETIVAKNRGLLPIAAAKPSPYTTEETREALARGAWVVDLRDPVSFGEGHIPGALNVWMGSPQFADRVGWFVPNGTPVVLVAQGPSDLERAVRGLSRVGVDEILGFVKWGMTEWRSDGLPVETVPQIAGHDLATWREERPELVVIDVREPFEWLEGHIEGAVHLPMREAVGRLGEVPPNPPKAVICSGGLRSSTVISALMRAGLRGFYNVGGGMTDWQKAGYETVTA
ncbi:MAG: rhodanese-like domain-containing protein [Candidatus Methylomirabilia bacterium]